METTNNSEADAAVTAEREIKEIVVISGKGGTGKTSLAASFAVLAGQAVIADCDVDAADMPLILEPRVQKRSDFRSGHIAVIRGKDCSGCGECLTHCRFEAISREVWDEDGRRETFTVDPLSCEGCGVCVRFCPEEAIDFPERLCGEWMISETRSGPMVHARLGAAAENSGKLVSIVRKEARSLAEKKGHRLIIVDGPPGIGCPVIAAVTGASLVLAVTEPTVSGLHDLERVLALARHFTIPAMICINKWDLNPEMTARIEQAASGYDVRMAGRVRYDPAVTRAQLNARAVVEIPSQSAEEIRNIWRTINLEE